VTAQIEALMRANLLDVFGERDPAKRRAAIARTYAEDVVFLDPDEVTTGHERLDAKAQRLLDGAPGFVFAEDGPVYVNHDMGHLAWAFGPADAPPVVRGFDTCFIENGLITRVYTVLLG
jgi:hypothetical protein